MSDLANTRLRTLVFSLLTVLTLASLLGTAFSPYLLVKSPLGLVAIAPAAHHVALAAASVKGPQRSGGSGLMPQARYIS